MSREKAIACAEEFFDRGEFFKLLSRRVAHRSSSQEPERVAELRGYLTDEMGPYLEEMGFCWRVVENPVEDRMPFLIAERIESDDFPTVLTYGHGDTVRGMDGHWREGLEPWRLIREGDRWYGRGAADNKGQHTINLAALALVLERKGALGFNVKVLIDMGEESGSPGLHRVCEGEKQALRADVLIASDGPRTDPSRPAIYGGSRGVFNFDLSLKLRAGGHHSGNWGGLLANPGVIMANALAALVDARGRILVPELKPPGIPDSVRRALAELEVTGRGGPEIDPNWGEPGLSLAEKVYGWNTLDILAFECGNPENPAHAIPPSARARCHIRFVAGSNPEEFIPAVRRRLDAHGFQNIEISKVRENHTMGTRLDPDHPWVRFAVESFRKTHGSKPDYLPNLGGTLPNDAFAEILGLPTVWVPHSYGGCSQHAPDEHLLAPIAREGMRLMTGLFWDLSEQGGPAAIGG